MKRILSCSLALSLCLLLSLPAVADAFFTKKDKAADKQGFIAVSESPLRWADAKAWCEQQDGRLPLLNGAASLTRNQIRDPKTVRIDGIGQINTGPGDGYNFADFTTPWPSDILPGPNLRLYWTGTEDSENSGVFWHFGQQKDLVLVNRQSQSDNARAACVPK
jgi:hypothetical protein